MNSLEALEKLKLSKYQLIRDRQIDLLCIIEKDLKAFEIMKKDLRVNVVKNEDGTEYDLWMGDHSLLRKINKDQYDLLKECLK